ncbi:hypothetical protein Raf01_88660 [Rugosimonospora africana]|uniref:Histidine kinase-, DNA gyrase B-, and HSP90-like ATPase n=2 Tax=Rugosimonospora africana TaxID=556532 RepID=A0A8J3VW85_9ACTN|nr:hypothetical protein Raf01_88660 [Rugosimonospora africana]
MFAERFAPHGSIDGHSVSQTLGTFSMDFWQVFLRETLQNSWDAREDPAGGVRFSIDAWRLKAAQFDALANGLLRERPPGALGGLLEAGDPIEVLTVTDSGTHGLGGPTRADRSSPDRRDFVDLVRNIGRDPAKGFAAGTYGYGKAVLFRASACATVVIFTRTIVRGRPTSRLIAMALTGPYDLDGLRHTGRHWWGRPDREVGAEPLIGQVAEEFAELLGMRRLTGDRTGTSIMVLAPRLDEDTGLRDVVETLAQTAADYAWPHLTAAPGARPALRVAFTCGGRAVPYPEPSSDDHLGPFVEAYHHCLRLLEGDGVPVQRWPWNIQEINGSRPQQRLGVLAWRTRLAGAVGAHERPPAEVALMRDPRLVVEYHPVAPDPSGQVITGVFVADPRLNDFFAAAEPPTHDRWQPGRAQRERYARNPVSQAINRLEGVFRDRRVVDPVDVTQTTDQVGVTRLASLLGTLLDTQPGGTDTRIPEPGPTAGAAPGAGTWTDGGGQGGAATAAGGEPGGGGTSQPPTEPRRPGTPPPPRPRRGTVTVRLHTRPRLTMTDRGVCADFPVDLDNRSAGDGVVLIAEPLVAVADGHPERPDGDVPVTVVGWHSRTEDSVHEGECLTVTPGTAGAWNVRVTQPADAAVTLVVRQEAVTT